MGQLLEEAINAEAITSLLDGRAVRDLLTAHRAGHADHSELLWGVLNLRLWRQQFSA